MGGGLLVVGFRVARPAGFGGAAEPVIGARQRNRALGDLGDTGEMPCAGLGVFQAAQRVPAGMEFGVGGVGRAFGGMRRNDAVGGLHVALIEQFARQDAALHPPRIGIDEGSAVRRRLQHDRGGLRKFLLPAQISGFGERVAGRTQIGRDGLEQAGRGLFAADRGGPRIRERFCAGEFSHSARRGDAFGIEHALHAKTVIRRRDDGAEFPDDQGFLPGVEFLGAPERGKHRARGLDLPKRRVRAGEQHDALERLRRGAAKGCHDRPRIGILPVERALAVLAQRSPARPSFERDGGCRYFAARHVFAAFHRDRPGEDVPVEAGFRQAVADGARRADIILGQCIEAAFQPGNAIGNREACFRHYDRGGRLGIQARAYGHRRRQGERCGDERKTMVAHGAHGVDHSLSLHDTKRNGYGKPYLRAVKGM